MMIPHIFGSNFFIKEIPSSFLTIVQLSNEEQETKVKEKKSLGVHITMNFPSTSGLITHTDMF